jgi:hypothetical protein
MPFLALSLCECKRSRPRRHVQLQEPTCRASFFSARQAQPVPRFLTLYTACMPCTASLSHAAWDIGIEYGA